MSDTSQARAPAADAGEPVDDGFDNAEDRAAFAEMREPDPVPGAEEAPADGAAPPAAAKVPAAAVDAPGPDDETDDEDDGAEATAPAVGADGKPAAGAEGGRVKKRVSFAKYERSEKARVAAEEKVSAVTAREARLDERLKIINEAIDTQRPPVRTAAEEDPEPDKEADLFGWLDWKKRDDVRRDDRMTKIESDRQAEVEERNLSTAYEEDASAFAREEPNFAPAYQFLMNNRVFELAQYFYGKDLSEEGAKLAPAEIKKIQATISTEERELVKQAIANDQRPAERMFKLARARGFRPAAPVAAPAAGAAAPAVNGKVPAAVPGSLAEEPVAGSVTDEIDRIKAGTAAGKSLSSGGGAPASPMTAKKLADLSDSDFGEMMDTMSPEELKAMFGS